MRMAANGSGWSQYYDCILYKISLDSFSQFILPRYPPFIQQPHHGFVITFETLNILNPLYDDHFFVSSPDPVFILHLPPASLSSLDHVTEAVDTILSKSCVPTTDPNTLVQHLLNMGRRYEQTSISTLVPLLFDFNVTTVLRNPTEYADWTHGGTMNSVILRTLRATEQFISNLEEEKIGFDDELSDSSTCTVCLEGFEEGSVCRLPCSHEFHHTCIVEWLRCNNRCPVCRFSMPWVRSVVIADDDNESLPLMNRLSSGCYSFLKENYNLLGVFCNSSVSP